MITIASTTTTMRRRLGQGLAAMAWGMASRHALALTAAGPSVRPTGFTPRRPPHGLLAHALRTVQDIYALARHAEAGRLEAREAALAEARLRLGQWQSRAEAAERQVATLERRLASSEMTALDLRSRIVCLHGKLATSTATARYQTLALALESQARDDEDAGAMPADQRAPA